MYRAWMSNMEGSAPRCRGDATTIRASRSARSRTRDRRRWPPCRGGKRGQTEHQEKRQDEARPVAWRNQLEKVEDLAEDDDVHSAGGRCDLGREAVWRDLAGSDESPDGHEWRLAHLPDISNNLQLLSPLPG